MSSSKNKTCDVVYLKDVPNKFPDGVIVEGKKLGGIFPSLKKTGIRSYGKGTVVKRKNQSLWIVRSNDDGVELELKATEFRLTPPKKPFKSEYGAYLEDLPNKYPNGLMVQGSMIGGNCPSHNKVGVRSHGTGIVVERRYLGRWIVKSDDDGVEMNLMSTQFTLIPNNYLNMKLINAEQLRVKRSNVTPKEKKRSTANDKSKVTHIKKYSDDEIIELEKAGEKMTRRLKYQNK